MEGRAGVKDPYTKNAYRTGATPPLIGTRAPPRDRDLFARPDGALPLDRGHPDHWIVRIRRTGVPVVGLHLRKRVRTTIPEPTATPVPGLLRRDFTAIAPNSRYVSVMTHLHSRHAPPPSATDRPRSP